jgi:HSP20 family protein
MLDVWNEMMALQRRMDDLFRTYLGPRARPTFPALLEGLRRPFAPISDVFAREGDLVVRVELPGVDPTKDVSITIEDDVLVVKGERSSEEEVKEKDYYRMESSFGAFERRLPIPENVDEDEIVASYADGVLEVVIPGAVPKVEETEETEPAKKTVPIKTAKAA